MAQSRVPEDMVLYVARQHQSGRSMRSLAAELGVPHLAIRRALRSAGLAPEGGSGSGMAGNSTKAATMEERRTQLAELLLGDAERMREQLWEPSLHQGFYGKDGELRELHRDQPTFSEQHSIVTSVNGLLKAANYCVDGTTSAKTINLIIETAGQLGLSGDGE